MDQGIKKPMLVGAVKIEGILYRALPLLSFTAPLYVLRGEQHTGARASTINQEGKSMTKCPVLALLEMADHLSLRQNLKLCCKRNGNSSIGDIPGICFSLQAAAKYE
jgi:hypothetical protein